jgi:putative Ca2+/H+ antiporter (TMEM165/GDT1 family)
VPEWVVGAVVVVMFAGFGLRALLTNEQDEDGEPQEKSGHSVFVTAFLLIFTAEFGDKTQLAVAGLSASLPPVPVWFGGTLALMMTSLLGVWAGRALLSRMPLQSLHRLSGLLFLGFAAYAAWHLWPEDAVGWLMDQFDSLQRRLE